MKLLILLFIISLTACSGKPPTSMPLPLPTMGAHDPSDEQLKEAMDQYLSRNNAPASSGYRIARNDLDGDGRREGLISLRTPYGHWCGFEGCTMIVFKAHSEGFTPLTTVRPVRMPIYISPIKTAGWKQIIARVSGRKSRAKDVALTYDGHSYPNNPEPLPEYASTQTQKLVKLFE